jgi:Ca2+-binding RTX toxin-like protein
VGGHGADTLSGNAGADVIDARDPRPSRTLSDCVAPCWRVRVPAGADDVWAGGDDDTVLARDGRPDVIRCEGGYDVVIADRRDRISPFGDCERVLR